MGILIEITICKKTCLIISILSTSSALFIFKYFNFFQNSFTAIGTSLGLHYSPQTLELLIPIGLSFHTFQSLSYVIEVYKGRQKAERHLGIYALYVMFYPQLVAGPIERPYNLLPQLHRENFVDFTRISNGLKLMAWGMFKKVVIADRLALLVNQTYGDVPSYQGPEFILSTIFFSIQIYCDFSGYSDIAVGAANVMGYKLVNNFNFPFLARSISEFWRHWHISFSSWMRDYLYFPLCKNKRTPWGAFTNLFLIFLFSGLWHGASWTYVFWGGINGLILIFGIWTRAFRNKLYNYIIPKDNGFFRLGQTITTFALFSFALVFFRAENIQDAFYIYAHLNTGWSSDLFTTLQSSSLRMGLIPSWHRTSFILIILLFIHDFLQQQFSTQYAFQSYHKIIRWSYYYALLLGIVFLGQYGQNKFIYFQF